MADVDCNLIDQFPKSHRHSSQEACPEIYIYIYIIRDETTNVYLWMFSQACPCIKRSPFSNPVIVKFTSIYTIERAPVAQ